MNTDDMKIEIEEGPDCFFRHSYGPLGLYGKNQEAMYGKKENLISRLENRYKVTLGKHVRVLRDDVILFFPTKTGLTGKLAFYDWDVFDADSSGYLGLISMKPCEPVSDRAWENFLHSVGIYDSQFAGGTALFAYQYRKLYTVPSATFETLHFTEAKIADGEQEDFDLF